MGTLKIRDWLLAGEAQEYFTIKDIAEHGCEGGVSGLIYYKETSRFHDDNEEEIWEIISRFADDSGQTLMQYLSVVAKDARTLTGLKNSLAVSFDICRAPAGALQISFVDFYPTYDKTYVTKKKENKMGLDQYAHLRGQEYEWDAKDDNQFYWRKHARLQKFMAIEHAKQNPVEKNENDMGLGFNGGPVYITEEVVRKLEEAIENDYFDYFAPDGFFWGQQFQEQQVKEYKAQDKKFLQWCKDMIAKKKVVEYHCSW